MSSLDSFSISNLFSVQGKVAVVTGGGTGIGKAIATVFAVNGSKVIICGRRTDVIESTAAELNSAITGNGSVIAITADVSTKAGNQALYDKIREHTDTVDILVNNAGYSSNWRDTSSLANAETLRDKLLSIEDSDFSNMTGIHVAGPYFLTAFCLPLFEKSKNPSVCIITSMAAEEGFRNKAVCEYTYAQSKAAASHMRGLLAAVLQNNKVKVRVNSLVPGLFASQLTTDANGKFYGVMEDQFSKIAAGRPGTLEEIASPMILFATNAYVNDESIRVDGGWLMNSSAFD